MNYLRIKSEIEATPCPIHNIRPLARLDNDHITLRCCCDMFTSMCMAELDQKLKGNIELNIVDAWEDDLYNKQLMTA